MTLSLLSLPVELILVIFDFLCPAVPPLPKVCEECRTSFLPSAEETRFAAPYSTAQLHSFSLVCHQSRRLCRPWLFSCLKITHTDQLRLLENKCLVDNDFANVIKRLNLARVDSPEPRTDDSDVKTTKRIYRYAPNILPALLRCLQSLEWLDLSAAQIDSRLLSALNSHPALTTVAVCDNNLQALRALFVSTTLSMSKIRVHSILSDFSLTLRSSALRSVMTRSPRLVHLSLRDSSNIKDGPSGSLFLPGLERLGIKMYPEPTHPMAWLQAFVAQHTSLQVINFSGVGSNWRQNSDVAFPLQFYDAVERQALTRTIALNAFSISRLPAASLRGWPVTELEMTIAKSAGVSGLRIASSLAPNASLLIIQMSRSVQHPVHIEDVIVSLRLFPCLRQLELHHCYRHLLYQGQAPWIFSPLVGKISRCTSAPSALLWIAAQVASLELLHMTDEGSDFDVSEHEKRRHHPWTLKATYRILRNRDTEYHGSAHMNVARRYRQAAVAVNRPIIYGRDLRPVI
ncbi:hypothetical protein B0H16DRAFT_955542 [Mycena metata]|uniref:F-box domain-containing protein n=1 Tax=Mycena metata TaxID=1033252 RepID=A0AAD7K5A8_9AGAR|nr:hypothetical protein B0H16DRAFT_955542 [Mycena metata]